MAAPSRGGAFERWTVRLLLPALLLALVLGVAGLGGRPLIDWRAWLDGPERGEWRALLLDGADVAGQRMSVIIADGAVQGGRDGCNHWGYSGERDPANGQPMRTSTLALCAQSPASAAYARLAYGKPRLRLVTADRLELSAGGSTGLFERWTAELAEAERRADEAQIAAQQAGARGVAGPMVDPAAGRTPPAPPSRPGSAPVPPPPPAAPRPAM